MTIKQATSWLSQPGIVAMIHDPTTRRALRVAVKALEQLPSATDTNVGTKLGTNLAEVGTDRAVKGFPIDADDLMLRVEEEYGFRSRDRLYDIIRKMPKYKLPPAHEPLTDKEQRIFLAAMERERKVCKEVDDQYTHEPYEVLLTKVCDEIKRKVKGALWS